MLVQYEEKYISVNQTRTSENKLLAIVFHQIAFKIVEYTKKTKTGVL